MEITDMGLSKVPGFHVKSQISKCSGSLQSARGEENAEHFASTSSDSSRAVCISEFEPSRALPSTLTLGSTEPNIYALPSTLKKNSKYLEEEKEALGSNDNNDGIGLKSLDVYFQSARSPQIQTDAPTCYRKSLADKRVYCYLRSSGLRDVIIVDAINGQHLEIPASVWDDCFIK